MADETEGVLWLEAHHRFTIVELAETCRLPQPVLHELVELGALSPVDPAAAQWDFSADCVPSLRRAARIAADLELEAQAIALVLTFLRRIERLESQVRDLEARLGR